MTRTDEGKVQAYTERIRRGEKLPLEELLALIDALLARRLPSGS